MRYPIPGAQSSRTLFNSVPFALFLPIVLLLYWFVFQRNLRLQNLFVLAASYFFYSWWDWRFFALVVLSSATDYLVGLALAASDDPRRRHGLLTLSLAVNLGCLGPCSGALLEANADVDLATAGGSTALWIASQSGHLKIVQSLRDANANLSVTNRNGITPFKAAKKNGNKEIAEILLAAESKPATGQFVTDCE